MSIMKRWTILQASPTGQGRQQMKNGVKTKKKKQMGNLYTKIFKFSIKREKQRNYKLCT